MLVVWGRVLIGFGLCLTGGVALGHALTTDHPSWWWTGGITLLTGALLVLSAVCARGRPAPPPVVSDGTIDGSDLLVPLLGALLIYKYQWVTHEQSSWALKEQRRSRGARRLGRILVEAGFITASQLNEALLLQHFRVGQEGGTRNAEGRLAAVARWNAPGGESDEPIS